MEAPCSLSHRNSPKVPISKISETNTMRHIKKFVSSGSRGLRGGRCITFCSDGSKANVKARVTAVIIFTHSICTGVMGRARPMTIAAMMVSDCPPLVGRIKRMASESERIEEVRKYIEATIAEIDSHTEDMEKLFKMDRWSKDSALYEIIINSYERHRNTLKRIQKIVEGGKVESGLYTLSAKSEIDMVKERIEKLENDLVNSESKLSDSEILDGFSEIKSGEAGRMSERKPKE